MRREDFTRVMEKDGKFLRETYTNWNLRGMTYDYAEGNEHDVFVRDRKLYTKSLKSVNQMLRAWPSITVKQVGDEFEMTAPYLGEFRYSDDKEAIELWYYSTRLIENI